MVKWIIAILLLVVCIILYISFMGDKIYVINSGEKQMMEDKLISREVLFGNPDHIATRISNDGQNISFLAPKEGVLNVWIAPASSPHQAKVITDEKQRGVRGYFWAKDNEHIIYAQDKKGDENWRLYSVHITSLKQVDLTPTEGVRASVLKLSSNFPKEMLISLNDRVPEYFDIYKVNIDTGNRELIYANTENYSHFVADDNFNIRVGYKMLPSGESEIYLFENGDTSKPKLFQTISVEDMLTTNPLHISGDGTKLFMIDSTDRNSSALIEVDLQSTNRKIIHSDARADIDDYLVDTKTKMVQGVAVEYLRKEWTILDKKISADIDYLSKLEDGDVEVVSRSHEDDKWIVAFSNSDSPHKYYLYDRVAQKAKFLFVSNSQQENLPFAKMHPVKIQSRDGLELVSYLTIPRWLDNGAGIPPHTIPLVLNVHGGPNARDSWGFSSAEQWLANRGYAVLNVNYRGSTGLGKDFINAGVKEHFAHGAPVTSVAGHGSHSQVPAGGELRREDGPQPTFGGCAATHEGVRGEGHRIEMWPVTGMLGSALLDLRQREEERGQKRGS